MPHPSGMSYTYPRHEAEINRRSLRSCVRALQHPSSLPSLLACSWRDTRDYYAARDVVDLERGELIQIVAYSRRMGLRMAGSALFLGLVVVVLLVEAFRAKYGA
ncbi:hypothetical protein F4779DRAFT_613700 [Xylariaceae sp. FL0662B]|nr:hypothetical protein F4779DRAFT_613700 [Xylariaceae sp. FL0662B]